MRPRTALQWENKEAACEEKSVTNPSGTRIPIVHQKAFREILTSSRRQESEGDDHDWDEKECRLQV